MNDPSSRPPSKGMAMIAAYRAERLSQRPVLRSTLHDSHVARRAERTGEPVAVEPGRPIIANVPEPVATVAEPAAIIAVSVFAGLVSTAVAELRNEASRMGDLEAGAMAGMPPDTFDAVDVDARELQAEPADANAVPVAASDVAAPDVAAEDTTAGSETAAPVAPEPPYDPPLAEIGFGPGMLIRLSQLGLHTTSDLAHANAVQLRSELGDISRLVDVDAWIRSAQQTGHATPGSPSAGR